VQAGNDVDPILPLRVSKLAVIGREEMMIRGDARLADEEAAAKHELVTLAVHPGREVLMRLVVIERQVQALNHAPMLCCREQQGPQEDLRQALVVARPGFVAPKEDFRRLRHLDGARLNWVSQAVAEATPSERSETVREYAAAARKLAR
jgi:hypothetical protein